MLNVKQYVCSDMSYFKHPSLQVSQNFNCSVSVKRQEWQWQMSQWCLFFCQQLILTNDTTAKYGSYLCQAMSCYIQSLKTPCTLCHSSLHQSPYKAKIFDQQKHRNTIFYKKNVDRQEKKRYGPKLHIISWLLTCSWWQVVPMVI